MEFTVACIGYAVGLGNLWRFPYLCYSNGGGAFLVPYFIVLLLVGMPIFLLELGVGQKFQVGGGEIWQRMHPALKGLGIASTIATFIVSCYYNVVVAWSLWYLFRSFAWPLPWDARFGGALEFWEVDTLHCRAHANASCSWDSDTQWPQRPGIAYPGDLVWPLVSCLALAWIIVWLCVVKGVHSAGKVAWFTALFPYAVLTIMLVRGLTLDGATARMLPPRSPPAALDLFGEPLNPFRAGAFQGRRRYLVL
jgi:SNF family Na+-dependent transporter